METLTVNKLHTQLGRLIARGRGRIPVCVSKQTFKDNREGDGVSILPVAGCRDECVVMADDDGGTKINKDGSESYRVMLVLFGYHEEKP